MICRNVFDFRRLIFGFKPDIVTLWNHYFNSTRKIRPFHILSPSVAVFSSSFSPLLLAFLGISQSRMLAYLRLFWFSFWKPADLQLFFSSFSLSLCLLLFLSHREISLGGWRRPSICFSLIMVCHVRELDRGKWEGGCEEHWLTSTNAEAKTQRWNLEKRVNTPPRLFSHTLNEEGLVERAVQMECQSRIDQALAMQRSQSLLVLRKGRFLPFFFRFFFLLFWDPARYSAVAQCFVLSWYVLIFFFFGLVAK